MKYAPVTAYRPDTETVEELYVVNDEHAWTAFTNLLSDAIIFNTREESERWIADTGYGFKTKAVTEKELFEARLKNE